MTREELRPCFAALHGFTARVVPALSDGNADEQPAAAARARAAAVLRYLTKSGRQASTARIAFHCRPPQRLELLHRSDADPQFLRNYRVLLTLAKLSAANTRTKMRRN